MKDYLCVFLLVVVCMLVVDDAQGQNYRNNRRNTLQRRLRNGDVIRIVQTSVIRRNRNRNNRNNGNGNGNGNNRYGNGNGNGNGIILGTPSPQPQITNPSNNIVAIIIAYPNVENLMQDLARTIVSKLKNQDTMFLIAGVDTTDTTSTTAMKAMFTATKQKSMAMGEEERAKTAMVKEMSEEMNLPPKQIADSVDGLLERFGIEFQGLGTKDDNCDQFVDIRCDPNAPYRTADGSCNNLRKPLWGRAFIPMRRFLQPVYDDQVSSPRTKSVRGGDLPSAREVSLIVHESDDRAREPGMTHLLMQFGQFLDHDITSTPTSSGSEFSNVGCCSDDASVASLDRVDMPPEDRDICFPIKVSPNDPRFRGKSCMSFIRSIQVSNTNCQVAPAEQLNQITGFIDASNVYGSSQQETDALRAFSGGLLKVSANDLLPEDDHPSCVKTRRTDYCFRAGDGRVNEQMGLATLHTIWVREHNRMARELSELNPHWNDEKLFQETRKILIAKMQHIIYNEFLPSLLKGSLRTQFGLNSLTQSHGPDQYDEQVDPSIRNAFATAAYRFGHSLVRTMFSQMDRGYQKIADLMLVSSFGNTSNLIAENGAGVDRYIRGFVSDSCGMGDRYLTPMVTQRLFEDGAGHSLDLAALNIQRGRDHGLPAYNEWRKWCRLRVARSFDSLSDHDANARRQLSEIYDDVDDIDLFAGGMSETAVSGTMVGPTFACIIAHQFKALKQGDRFFYERKNDVTGFSHWQMITIKKTRLSQVLCDNTNIETMQTRAFVKVIPKNERRDCSELRQETLHEWADDNNVREAGRRSGNTPRGNPQPSGSFEWGPWSRFGACTDGKRWRERVCQTTGNAQPNCVGPSSESEVCRSGADCSKSVYNMFTRLLCNQRN